MAQQQYVIKRQVIKGVHSSRRQVYEYLYSQGGVWGENRKLADTFTSANLDANVAHWRRHNQGEPGVLSTTSERL